MNTTTGKNHAIQAVPVIGDWGHTFWFCGRCDRDLEVTTGAAGFRHTDGRAVVAMFSAQQARRAAR